MRISHAITTQIMLHSLRIFSNIKRHTMLMWRKVILEVEASQDKAKIVAHARKPWIPNDHGH
jgi:hypothetical protein